MKDDIEAIAKMARAQFEATSSFGGTVWFSERNARAPMKATSCLPSGLHIVVGTGSMVFSHPSFGERRLRGPALTAMLVPEDGLQVRARVNTGPSSSFGIHLPLETLETSHLVSDSLSKAEQLRSFHCIDGNAAKRMAPLALPIDQLHSGHTRRLLFEARALEIAAALAGSIDVPQDAAGTLRQRKNASATRDYIEAHLSEAFTLNDVAISVGVSLRTMTAHFSLVFGESVGAYLTRRRLEGAFHHIALGGSVAQAAYDHGYQPGALSHAFKRRYGFSPSSLSQQVRG